MLHDVDIVPLQSAVVILNLFICGSEVLPSGNNYYSYRGMIVKPDRASLNDKPCLQINSTGLAPTLDILFLGRIISGFCGAVGLAILLLKAVSYLQACGL